MFEIEEGSITVFDVKFNYFYCQLQVMDKARSLIHDAILLLDAIPPDVTLDTGAGNNVTEDTPTNNNSEEMPVSASAPPVSTTKGSRRRLNGAENVPQPHFRRDK